MDCRGLLTTGVVVCVYAPGNNNRNLIYLRMTCEDGRVLKVSILDIPHQRTLYCWKNPPCFIHSMSHKTHEKYIRHLWNLDVDIPHRMHRIVLGYPKPTLNTVWSYICKISWVCFIYFSSWKFTGREKCASIWREPPSVMPLGLSCWHMSLMYLYSAIYNSCELIMCTTGSLDTHTRHFCYLDT